MNKSDILTLYEYNYWANARVLEAAARITPEQYAAPANLSHGSLRATLTHALSAEMVWRMRCEGNSPTALLSEQAFATLDALRKRWQEEERLMRAYLETLTEEQLQQPLRYTSTKGAPFSNVLWHILAHVVNHGTQTRSEAGIALAAYGQSPGDLDLILYLRDRA